MLSQTVRIDQLAKMIRPRDLEDVDIDEQASDHSFPASDPPAWTSVMSPAEPGKTARTA